MSRLLLLRGERGVGANGGGGGLPTALVVADVLLAVVDAAIAALSFSQLLRIHFRNQQLGWTRQKIFHLLIGSSNIGYLVYFTSAVLAACKGWQCWLNGCGFILMAFPQILFLTAFLLLLSFWVDLGHQAKDEEEDDEYGITESFLEKSTSKPGPLHLDGRRRCCSFWNAQLGSRQKFVVLVMILSFALTIAFTMLIWGGRGRNCIDPSLIARVYQDIFSVAMLLLGGALAGYGFLLFSKMSRVRSEMASTDMQKVASLAAVALVCFASCSILDLVTNIPVPFYWHSGHSDGIICSLFIFLYYFVGSAIPSGFILWVMREMPPPTVAEIPPRPRVVTVVSNTTTDTHNPHWRTTVASSQSKALKASPI